MSNCIVKLENHNEEPEISLTHDLQDCIEESLDFNFNNVFASSSNRSSGDEKIGTYLQTIEHSEENVG